MEAAFAETPICSKNKAEPSSASFEASPGTEQQPVPQFKVMKKKIATKKIIIKKPRKKTPGLTLFYFYF